MRLVQIEIEQQEKARKDVAEMDALLARHGNERGAIKAFAQEKSITEPRARRRYQDSKKLVEKADAEVPNLVIPFLAERCKRLAERLAICKMARALIEMDGLNLNIDQQTERLLVQFPDASEDQIDMAFGRAARWGNLIRG